MLAATQTAIINPYPGLRPFEPEEDYLFFGREHQTINLLRLLRQTRFVAVVGSSGSGKSSLVRAGLVPSLQGGSMARAGSTWRTAIFRPGDNPITNLAHALYDSAHLGEAQGTCDVDLAILETTLLSSSAGLSAVVQQSRLAPHENLLVVADQFEEIFRYRSSFGTAYSETSSALVKLLLNAAANPMVRVYVVLTMRSDFIGRCPEFPGLAKAVSDGQFLVPRLSRDELRRAITGPATVAEGEIAPRLIVRLLNEVGDDPDQLPVLQHALMRSWDFWRQHHTGSGPLDFVDYEAVGTMKTALSRHAEEAYAELHSTPQRRIAEMAFRALAETDEDGRLIRRPSTIDQIAAITGETPAAIGEVIDHFRAPHRGFIVLRTGSFLDLSHESLMRIWDRLAQWAKREAEAAALYRRLANAAELHARGAESLWINPQLTLGLIWLADTRPTTAWADRYAGNLDRTLTFLESSRKAELRGRFIRWATLTILVVLVIAVFAVYAAVKANDNTKLRKANKQLEESNTFLAAQIVPLSQQQTSLENEVAALKSTQSGLLKDVTAQSGAIRKAADQLRALQREGDSLAAQVQSGLYDRDYELQRIKVAVSSNEQIFNGFPDSIKGILSQLGALSKLNAENRALMTKIIELKIPLPPMPLTPLALPMDLSAPLKAPGPKPPVYLAQPDAYLIELLKKNADLLAQAQQVANANHALAAEVTLLREQNERLAALSADLRVQAARLDGEVRLFSSQNDLRRQQALDAQALTSRLQNLENRLSKEFDSLESVHYGLNSITDKIYLDTQFLTPINKVLAKAIEDAQAPK